MKLNTRQLKLKKSARKNAIAIFIIGIAVYLGFEPLFNLATSKIATNVIGAAFGTIFVIVITMYLLNKQTEIESENSRGEKIFEKKIEIYSNILEKSREMIEDGVLKKEEMVQAMFQSIQLQMIADDEAISAYKEVYSEILNVFSNTDGDEVDIDMNNQGKILLKLHSFASACRVDLEVSDNAPGEKLSSEWSKLLATTNEKLNKRDYSEFKFNGESLGKTPFVRKVVLYYVSLYPNISESELLNIFPPRLNTVSGKDEDVKDYRSVFMEINKAKALQEERNDKSNRFSFNKKDYLKIDNKEYVISNQWGGALDDNKGNFRHFFNHCKTIPEIAKKMN